MNMTILKEARKTATEVLQSGKDVTEIHSFLVGDQCLYISTDPSKIIGPDTITIEGKVFYVGFCRDQSE